MDFLSFLKGNTERVAAAVAVVIGLIAILLGWLGVSRSGLVTQQIPYLISGGVFGIFALGVGGTLWISSALRDDWRRLSDIHDLLSVRQHSDEPTEANYTLTGADMYDHGLDTEVL